MFILVPDKCYLTPSNYLNAFWRIYFYGALLTEIFESCYDDDSTTLYESTPVVKLLKTFKSFKLSSNNTRK